GRCTHRVGVDELVVLGGVRKAVDHCLVDGEPAGGAEFRSDKGGNIFQMNICWHRFSTDRFAPLLEGWFVRAMNFSTFRQKSRRCVLAAYRLSGDWRREGLPIPAVSTAAG